MSRDPFGWDYPAGAAGHPDAPWNATDPDQCPKCGSWETTYLGRYDGTQCNECRHCWGYDDPDAERDQERDDAMTDPRQMRIDGEGW